MGAGGGAAAGMVWEGAWRADDAVLSAVHIALASKVWSALKIRWWTAWTVVQRSALTHILSSMLVLQADLKAALMDSSFSGVLASRASFTVARNLSAKVR